jgi:hypothetical protein
VCFQVFGASYSFAALDVILNAATKHASAVQLQPTAFFTTLPRKADTAPEKVAAEANVDRAALKAEAAPDKVANLSCHSLVYYQPGNPCRNEAGPNY